MIHIYQNTAPGAFQVIEHIQPNSWVQLLSPSADEVNHVAKTLAVPIEFLTAVQNRDQRPRMDTQEGHTLLIVHVPYNDPAVQNNHDEVKYRTIPLGIVFSKHALVTICEDESLFNKGFLNQYKLSVGEHATTHNTLSVLNRTAHAFIEFMQQIERAIDHAEQELSHSYRNQELYTLLYLNESLLYMATSLKQIHHMMQQLDADELLIMNAADRDTYADTLVELQQVSAVTEISQLNLNNVMDAYGNIIQNNVSHVVKLLTAITIILSIPTLIASIYGMNVPLPYQDEPHAFSAVIASMVVFSALVAYVFHKKRYF